MFAFIEPMVSTNSEKCSCEDFGFSGRNAHLYDWTEYRLSEEAIGTVNENSFVVDIGGNTGRGRNS